jgi:hypothetical protein
MRSEELALSVGRWLVRVSNNLIRRLQSKGFLTTPALVFLPPCAWQR